MRIRKFVAPSIREALEQIKEELGEDAIILSSQKMIKGGKEMLEVTAAVDEETPKAYSPSPLKNPVFESIERELKSVKTQVGRLTDFLKIGGINNLPKPLMGFYLELVENGMEERLAFHLLKGVQLKLKEDQWKDRFLVRDNLQRAIARMIPTSSSFDKPDGKPVVVALIGPTGVGKTTTIAKLAANNKIFENKKVSLISTDTYRIAAVEQLKTFADIADIPVEVVYSPNEMEKALSRFGHMDLVFIDTPGRSQKNSGALRELKGFMDRARPQQIHLVLSLTTKLEDMFDAIDKFGLVPIDKLIFTKLDETNTYGPLLSVLERVRKPVSYITDGQDVPDDVHRADPNCLARMVMGRALI